VAYYQLTASDVIIRTGDGASIPNNPANRDRIDYEEWLAKGNAPGPYVGPTLAEVKLHLRFLVDGEAERERLKYVTDGAGQALVYEAKRSEVNRWRAAGSPVALDAAMYPWASARAARREVSAHDVMVDWAAQVDAWVTIGVAIENVREGAKESIAAASTEGAARAVTWSWPV
jgi:hypothetical protein